MNKSVLFSLKAVFLIFALISSSGCDRAYKQGFQEGYDSGEHHGYNKGVKHGEKRGYKKGFYKGKTKGYELGEKAGFNNGFKEGYFEGNVALIKDNALPSFGFGLLLSIILMTSLVCLYFLRRLFRKPIEHKIDMLTSTKEEITEAKILSTLNGLISESKQKLSPDSLNCIVSISESILEIMPHLITKNKIDGYDLYTVKKMVLNYLPETLAKYFSVPSDFVLKSGQTAQENLLEQLHVIDKTLEEIIQNIYANDANDLLANQRFLEERFSSSSNIFYK